MIRISRDKHGWSFDRHTPPAATVTAPETVILETHDARAGTIKSERDSLEVTPAEGFNPVTGPVYVSGAVPSDALAVTIESIELGPQAFTGVKVNTGLLKDRSKTYVTRIAKIEGGQVVFGDRFRFPVRPMIGTIGVAPAREPVSSFYPGSHGGNMDNNLVAEGATVHLPVFVEGALFALGDVHPSMGDGEISIVGLEAAAVVTVSIELEKGAGIGRPWIETCTGDWVTTGDDPDPAASMRQAAEEMVDLLRRRLDVSFEEAYMLATIRGDLGICQAADPGTFPVTTRFVMPASIVNPERPC